MQHIEKTNEEDDFVVKGQPKYGTAPTLRLMLNNLIADLS